MGRTSVLFRSVSATAFCVYASLACTNPLSQLQQEDLGNPDTIAAWLKANGSAADRKQADALFQQGLKEKARQSWGTASKSFGESALRFPAPKTLIEYANAKLHGLSDIRIRDKTITTYERSDMATVEAVLRSALASDALLNSLSEPENKQVRVDVKCVAAFLQTGDKQADCRPLQMYGR